MNGERERGNASRMDVFPFNFYHIVAPDEPQLTLESNDLQLYTAAPWPPLLCSLLLVARTRLPLHRARTPVMLKSAEHALLLTTTSHLTSLTSCR